MSPAAGRMKDVMEIDDAATRWSTDDPTGRPLLVLLHGYGSDEDDLFGLVRFLPDAFAVASVAAPLTPPWPLPGRSWYPIDGLDGRDPSHITAAAEALVRWLEPLATQAPSVALLGFSQGAAVSLQALRIAPDLVGTVVALSGYASTGDLPLDAQLAQSRPPVFWGRGTHDDIIGAHLLQHTTEWLPGHSTLTGRVYPGLTHSISEDELLDVRRFLDTWLES